MKWTGMVALVLVLAATGLAPAIEPAPVTIRIPNTRGPLHSAANWWARYGEPVNQAALDAVPAESVAAPVGWNENGPGYVYGLGSCDYTYPCTDWQWANYESHSWACWGQHGWGHRCHGGLFGRCGHGRCGDCGCADKVAHGCAAPALDCVAKVPDCDVAPKCDVAKSCCHDRHFHWHWKGVGFWNKHCGCDTSAPSCGCAAPVDTYSPEQSPPKPTADEASKAALVWPLGPVR